MIAELRQPEANVRGLHRMLCEQIDEATKQLAGKPVSAKGIHASRKSIQRARATLRLMRDALPAATYRRTNLALRDAARPLSAMRDARILLDALERLGKLYGPAARRCIPAAFRRTLERGHADVRRTTFDSAKASHPSGKKLLTIRQRVARWRISAGGWSEIGEGLKRVYRQGRIAMKDARKTPSAGNLHEWRKQAKYLWHQLQLLEPIRPRPIGELAARAHKLSDYLGDDHDLAVLREKALAHRDAFPGPGGASALFTLIDRRQTQLRDKAFRVGGRIYAEKPAAFAARLGRYWRRWQREKTTPRSKAA